MNTIDQVIAQSGLKARRNFNEFNESGSKNKILIVGHSGSGKSTLANKLSGALNIRVVHIDEELWKIHHLPKEVYERAKAEIVYRNTHSTEPVIVEGVQLLDLFDLTDMPVIIMQTNPITAAWRQSLCGSPRNAVFPISFYGALKRNLFRYGPKIRRLMSDVTYVNESFFTFEIN